VVEGQVDVTRSVHGQGDRDAFHALFTNLPPLRGFFEQLIGMRSQ